MAKLIDLPDGTRGEFPDDMSDDAITSVLQKQFAPPAPYKAASVLDKPVSPPQDGKDYGYFNLPAATDLMQGIASTPGRLVKSLAQMAGARVPDWAENASTVPQGVAGTVGGIAGDIGATLLPMGGIAKATQTLAAPLRLGAAAGEQALYGAALSPDNQKEGALYGAVGGAGAHALGRAMKGLVKPTAEAQYLMNQGIQPTAGQAMGAGSALKRAEDYVAKMPVAGASIRSTREQALKDFQRVSRDAVEPGMNSLDDISKLFNQAYTSTLEGAQFANQMRIPKATDLIDVANTHARKSALASALPVIDDVLTSIDGSPASYHWAERALKDMAFQYKSSALAAEREYGNVIHDAATALKDAWRMKLMPRTQDALAAIDKQYSQFVPIRKAGTTGVGTLAAPEQYTPRQLLSAVRAGDKAPSKSTFLAGGMPQQELAQTAENVLGSTVPKSTEAGLAALLGGGGLATYAGMGVPAAALGGTAYLGGTRPVQKFLTGNTDFQRSELGRMLVDALRRGAPSTVRRVKEDE